jgi:tetratricopeptide (TPR) repeat protein
MAASAYAQSAREQLQQMVEQLQKAPSDSALRERIIKLAAEVKPAPAIPEEANRFFVRGNVFLNEAKDATGYELAISAFREALRIAPWWGDAYINLAAAQGSAGKFDDAIASLKLFIAAVPAGSAEAREGQNRIYALEAKSEMAAKAAATAASVAAEKRRPSLEGNWSVSGFMYFEVTRDGERFALKPGKMLGRDGMWRATNVVLDAQRIQFTVEQPACPQCRSGYDLKLSPSGNELTGTLWRLDGSREPTANITRTP